MLKKNNQIHSFHLVDPSPWPILAAFSAFIMTAGLVLFMHGYTNSYIVRMGLITLLIVLQVWWRDVIREATFEGQHTNSVQMGLRLGVLLFIVSEIMFFFAFFWAFFHSSFNPSIAIGGVWPPAGLIILDPWKIPLLNTLILLSSGATLTLTHHLLVLGKSVKLIEEVLWFTMILAVVFTSLQVLEYITAPFSMSDGIYGSTFYMATGFHGFHVLIGTCFLFVGFKRLQLEHFTRTHHFGFEAAAWYWHFVDVVWLFLFITIYWWGS